MDTKRKYVVLGIHFDHDAGAAIVVDGQIMADVSEERFNRSKHSGDDPVSAIGYCLQTAGVSVSEVDEIAVSTLDGGEPIARVFGQRPALPRDERRVLRTLQRLKRSFYRLLAGRNRPKTRPDSIVTPLYLRQFFLGKLPKITFVDHHLAHAASAYYTSNDKRKMVIATADGAGGYYSSCIWLGENGGIEPLVKYGYDSSIGWFYSNVTEALGWWHGDGEGKTMGLAPYGDYEKCRGQLDRFYPKFSDGLLVEPYTFPPFSVYRQLGAIQWHSDDALKIAGLVKKYGRENIAAEAQRVLEEQMMAFVLPWLKKQNTKVLATSGGVFLNVKLNQRIWMSGEVETFHPYPNPGDAGLALGAALYAAHRNGTLAEKVHDHLYWGPEYGAGEIEKILKLRGLNYRRSDNAPAEAAKFLVAGQIVGWFQGRMESGPRALGNRSILMSPKDARNKNIINARVKFREAFRPFCPSLIDEAKGKYLVKPRSERFMITSFDCPASRKDEIPAVVHVDGTLRPQTVTKSDNPKYWELISEFGKLTGTPVVLNTSFNVRGEPIICSPREAIRCFFDSGIDVLFLGDFVIEKPRLTTR
ncbi:MAG: carbamoyltransferase C-terminal domain-containing protein [Candidatus Liptonbacteria bacterium]